MQYTILAQARAFARQAHGSQRYGTFPYEKHLNDVQNVLVRFGYTDVNYLISSWLHDTIEDTETTEEVIRELFGHFVANLVGAVSGHGKNRRERLINIANNIVKFPQAAPLKVADRIANIEHSLLRSNDKLSMYLKEHPIFMMLVPKFANDGMFEHLQYLQQLGVFSLGIMAYNKMINRNSGN